MSTEVTIPVLPESIDENSVHIAKLYVSAGQEVERNQHLFDVETDKVILEVVSPQKGLVRDIRIIEGQPVESGQTVMSVEIPVVHMEERAHESTKASSLNGDGNKVFIVHGHDEAALQAVARCIEKLGLEAIILHEQLNEGKTIIEKFEHYSNQISFAVVLMTPDDVGGMNAQNLQRRARQNVILELGFFTGLFGRERIFVLKKENVEVPSDYMGVVYTDMDKSGGWKLSLAKELSNAGLKVDLTKVITI